MTLRASLTGGHRRFLTGLLGRDALFDPAALKVHASDASLRTGTALAVLRPRNAAQVAAILEWAQRERVAVHTRGRGTGLSGGCVPTQPGVVLSTLGLSRILDISATDFVAEVEPGVCTADLQMACAAAGLFYPPDPASAGASSVGGNVATGAGGLRAVKYGVTRDYVLGVEACLPSGRTVQLGGRSHKDVVGLDLARLFVGSEGTLGVMTRIILKLLPLPPSRASLLAGFASLEESLSAMDRVFRAGTLPAALEFMNETVLDLLSGQDAAVPWPGHVRSLLLIQVDGNAQGVAAELSRLEELFADAPWRMSGRGRDEEAVWAVRRRISPASYQLGPDRIGGDMAVPRGSLLAAVREMECAATEHGKRLIAFGHAGDGNIHANLHYDAADPDDAARTLAAHHALDRVVLAHGGSISGEHGAGVCKDVSGQLGQAELDLMRRVRQAFDPLGILNPGKAY